MVIRYTNGYQFLHTILLMIGNIVALGLVLTILDAVPDAITNWMPGWLNVVLALGVVIATFAYAPLIYSKTILPWWISSWLYARFHLGVSITASEGEKISFLFDGTLPGGGWSCGGIVTASRSSTSAWRRAGSNFRGGREAG